MANDKQAAGGRPGKNKPAYGRWIGLVLLLAAGGLYWHHHQQALASASAGAPDGSGKPGGGGKHGQFGGPMPVQVRPVVSGDLHVYLEGLGSVTPANSITLHTRVSGELMSLNFHEGETVKAGQVIAVVDPRPYQVQLTQALGQQAKDQAALEGARIDLKRYQGLLAQDSIASQQVDTQLALVHQDEGAVKADQGAVDSARLNLVYTRVTTSVGGVAGLRQVDVGNVVNPGDTNGIVVINLVQPIYVLFTVPEDNVPAVASALHQGQTLAVDAWDRNDQTKLESGKVQSIDNQIDTSTGTLRIRAVFDNKDGLLFPDQFVNAHLLLETRHNVPLIPSAAVQRGSNGTFVFVMDDSQHVAVRPITIGPVDGDNVQVLTGLEPGETVVIDGADKLKDGSKVSVVTPQDLVAPAAGSGGHHHHHGAGNGQWQHPDGAAGSGQWHHEGSDGAADAGATSGQWHHHPGSDGSNGQWQQHNAAAQ